MMYFVKKSLNLLDIINYITGASLVQLAELESAAG